MDDLVILEGKALDSFLEVIAYMAERRDRTGTLRVCVDDGTLKLKVDRGTWSPPFGHRDPECEAARAAATLDEGPTDWVQRLRPSTPELGHGHVKPRPDGMKARCGGPALCPDCALEAQRDGFNHGPGGASCHA